MPITRKTAARQQNSTMSKGEDNNDVSSISESLQLESSADSSSLAWTPRSEAWTPRSEAWTPRSEASDSELESWEDIPSIIEQLKNGKLEYVTRYAEHQAFELEAKKNLLNMILELDLMKSTMDSALNAMRTLCPEVKNGKFKDAVFTVGNPKTFEEFVVKMNSLCLTPSSANSEEPKASTSKMIPVKCASKAKSCTHKMEKVVDQKETLQEMGNSDSIKIILKDGSKYEVALIYKGSPDVKKTQDYKLLVLQIENLVAERNQRNQARAPPTLSGFKCVNKLQKPGKH